MCLADCNRTDHFSGLCSITIKSFVYARFRYHRRCLRNYAIKQTGSRYLSVVYHNCASLRCAIRFFVNVSLFASFSIRIRHRFCSCYFFFFIPCFVWLAGLFQLLYICKWSYFLRSHVPFIGLCARLLVALHMCFERDEIVWSM